MKNRLLVIIPDRLSDLIRKGEITARYYNPGELFEEVHILMTNDDRPDTAALQKTVGRAKLYLHNLSADKQLFLKTLAWRPSLLRRWAKAGVDMARTINPSMIRCHGNYLNGYLAYEIKQQLGIPYVVSLHTNPVQSVCGRARNMKEVIFSSAIRSVERVSLRHADLVMPVYEPILPYLKQMGVAKFEVIHNVLNQANLRKKDSYCLHDPVKVISVGRIFYGKYPSNLIMVLKYVNMLLTIVGDGPEARPLKLLAENVGVAKKVEFIASINNDALCKMLPNYDIFATHSEYSEISKAVLEALLTGLPVILNKRKSDPVPELQGEHLMLVDDTVEAYRWALDRLITDHEYRKSLGEKAYAYSQEHWAPEKMESKTVNVYKRVIGDTA